MTNRTEKHLTLNELTDILAPPYLRTGLEGSNMSWREELKAGDDVVVNTGGFVRLTTTPGMVVARVDRVTKTQIVIGAHRYLKRSGFRVGSSGPHRPCIFPASEAYLKKAAEQLRASNIRNAITALQYNETRLPDDVVELLLQAHAKLKEREKNG